MLDWLFLHGAVSKQKTIWRNLTVSQYFRPVIKMGSQTGKTFCDRKLSAVMLIFHSRRIFIVIFKRTKCNNEEKQVISCWFFSWFSYWNSVLKFMFLLNNPNTESFLCFSIISPAQCCPEKAKLMRKFCSWYLIKKISGWCTHYVYPQVIWI